MGAISGEILLSVRLTDNNLVMFRFVWRPVIALSMFAISATFAQSPTPSPSPSAAPTREDLLNSLGPADVQAAIALIKSNFTNPDALNDTEMSRATLDGLLVRMPRGVILLPGKENTAAVEGPVYAEIFEGHIGYLRLGALSSANLKSVDRKLNDFASKKVDALIVDLRDSAASNDFEVGAEFAKRFCPKGKALFTLRNPAARQDRQFTSDRDPTFQGVIVILADRDTTGGAEALADVLRLYDKALIVGQTTAGRAVEYSDLPLPGGKILRVAIAEAVLPDGQSLFPDGVKPDLPVEMAMADKRQIFQVSGEKGMAPFVYEAERPHLNEAALLAGTNPDVDAAELLRRNRGREKLPVRDPVLQRALDVVTSLEIYQKR
jgi:hypothetical protein